MQVQGEGRAHRCDAGGRSTQTPMLDTHPDSPAADRTRASCTVLHGALVLPRHGGACGGGTSVGVGGQDEHWAVRAAAAAALGRVGSEGLRHIDVVAARVEVNRTWASVCAPLLCEQACGHTMHGVTGRSCRSEGGCRGDAGPPRPGAIRTRLPCCPVLSSVPQPKQLWRRSRHCPWGGEQWWWQVGVAYVGSQAAQDAAHDGPNSHTGPWLQHSAGSQRDLATEVEVGAPSCSLAFHLAIHRLDFVGPSELQLLGRLVHGTRSMRHRLPRRHAVGLALAAVAVAVAVSGTAVLVLVLWYRKADRSQPSQPHPKSHCNLIRT